MKSHGDEIKKKQKRTFSVIYIFLLIYCSKYFDIFRKNTDLKLIYRKSLCLSSLSCLSIVDLVHISVNKVNIPRIVGTPQA